MHLWILPAFLGKIRVIIMILGFTIYRDKIGIIYGWQDLFLHNEQNIFFTDKKNKQKKGQNMTGLLLSPGLGRGPLFERNRTEYFFYIEKK